MLASPPREGYSRQRRPLEYGDILIVDVIVEFLKRGDGPVFVADPRFGRELGQAFVVAGGIAALAIGYDPRFLGIRVVVPKAPMFQANFYIDGPSAGVSAAVGVASAMLQDPVRPKLCMTGEVKGLEIEPVGGLDKKLRGCRRLGFVEMLIPKGQRTFVLSSLGTKLRVAIREAGTLEEAYRVATGKRLRRVSE